MEINLNSEPKIPYSLTKLNPSGLLVNAKILNQRSPEEWKKINKIASEIRKDPLKMQKLADRIYDLMQQELQIDSERNRGLKHPY